MGVLGAYRSSILRLPWGSSCRLLAALPQNRPEWALRLPARMVPLCLRDHWRPLSRTLRVSNFHCHDIRPKIYPGYPVVSYDCAKWQCFTKVDSRSWNIPNIHLRWLDVCYFHGWSWLAWHLHDLIPIGYCALDHRLYQTQPTESEIDQVSEDCCFNFLCNNRTVALLLHPAQSSPCCRRQVFHWWLSQSSITNHESSIHHLRFLRMVACLIRCCLRLLYTLGFWKLRSDFEGPYWNHERVCAMAAQVASASIAK